MSDKRNQGLALIISGPSGVGKGTVISKLLESFSCNGDIKDTSSNFELSLSYSTRKPRGNETNGKDYIFVSVEEFKQKIANSEFAEWAQVHGNYYGTSVNYLKEIINGKRVIFEIDVQGAKKLINLCQERQCNNLSIFLEPPSMADLVARLNKRGTETEESLAIRYKNAQNELAAGCYFDKTIVNDRIEQTVVEIKKIIMEKESGNE